MMKTIALDCTCLTGFDECLALNFVVAIKVKRALRNVTMVSGRKLLID